ncbi:hypothetical protein BCR44DRAFT_83795 [Catenaria anguillulae PL171]|uniref:Uncharacterized protein n=1 Tax=Catenaria anguillulae PL171 TaxID=765915 RepID=A0A1Y2HJI3_9FUNG|nr:hypothetical protein BCR44DRAFT_83795 [Catenaria anguillulae PL171]
MQTHTKAQYTQSNCRLVHPIRHRIAIRRICSLFSPDMMLTPARTPSLSRAMPGDHGLPGGATPIHCPCLAPTELPGCPNHFVAPAATISHLCISHAGELRLLSIRFPDLDANLGNANYLSRLLSLMWPIPTHAPRLHSQFYHAACGSQAHDVSLGAELVARGHGDTSRSAEAASLLHAACILLQCIRVSELTRFVPERVVKNVAVIGLDPSAATTPQEMGAHIATKVVESIQHPTLSNLSHHFAAQRRNLGPFKLDPLEQAPCLVAFALGIEFPMLSFSLNDNSGDWIATAASPTSKLACRGHGPTVLLARTAAMAHLVFLAAEGVLPSAWNDVQAGRAEPFCVPLLRDFAPPTVLSKVSNTPARIHRTAVPFTATRLRRSTSPIRPPTSARPPKSRGRSRSRSRSPLADKRAPRGRSKSRTRGRSRSPCRRSPSRSRSPWRRHRRQPAYSRSRSPRPTVRRMARRSQSAPRHYTPRPVRYHDLHASPTPRPRSPTRSTRRRRSSSPQQSPSRLHRLRSASPPPRRMARRSQSETRHYAANRLRSLYRIDEAGQRRREHAQMRNNARRKPSPVNHCAPRTSSRVRPVPRPGDMRDCARAQANQYQPLGELDSSDSGSIRLMSDTDVADADCSMVVAPPDLFPASLESILGAHHPSY